MRRLGLGLIAATFALLGSASLAAVPQAKIRIAIWDFENNSERSWWFSGDLGPAARNQIDTAFSENARLSSMFSVIEREKLGMVMKEQGLGAGGAVDPQTAARVGKILGVKYIVTGGIDKFSINTTRGGIAGIGGSMTTADAAINLRFIDTTTAERVISISAGGQVKKGGGNIRGANLSREAEWGIASEAVQKASAAVVEKLVTAEYLDKVASAAGAGGGIDMRVIKVDGTRAYINVGSTAGIKVGDKFRVFKRGEELVDPATGAKLGAEEKQTGTGVVTEVNEKFSIMTITGAAGAGDVLKK
ncbi:MAG TPA: CsgG/HfaB family protein [Vicinamibacterales bacterium]|jgi:curli biogenesis system outer membrane secretion channel CsgG